MGKGVFLKKLTDKEEELLISDVMNYLIFSLNSENFVPFLYKKYKNINDGIVFKHYFTVIANKNKKVGNIVKKISFSEFKRFAASLLEPALIKRYENILKDNVNKIKVYFSMYESIPEINKIVKYVEVKYNNKVSDIPLEYQKRMIRKIENIVFERSFYHEQKRGSVESYKHEQKR